MLAFYKAVVVFINDNVGDLADALYVMYKYYCVCLSLHWQLTLNFLQKK